MDSKISNNDLTTIKKNIIQTISFQKEHSHSNKKIYTENLNLLNSLLKLFDYEHILDYINSSKTNLEQLRQLDIYIIQLKYSENFDTPLVNEALSQYKNSFEITLKSFIITKTIGENLSCNELQIFLTNLMNLQKQEKDLELLISNAKKVSTQLNELKNSKISEIEKLVKDFHEIISYQNKHYADAQKIDLELKSIFEFYENTDTEELKKTYLLQKEKFDNDINTIQQDLKAAQLKTQNLNKEIVQEELAHYFSAEAEDLFKNQQNFMKATFGGMTTIFLISFAILCSAIAECEFVKPQNAIFLVPIYMVLTWFTWFTAKQYSYYKQIIDEYNYKTALSKSYIIYRDEAKKYNNEEILILLLGSIINNVTTSPIQSVKSDCHTPFSEILNAAKEAGKVNIKKHTED